MGGKRKRKEITKISHATREIIIWQIHSGFALKGTPCSDTAGKGSSVIGDLENFFERTFFIHGTRKISIKISYVIFIKWIFTLPLSWHFFSQLSDFKFLTSKWDL